MSTWITRVKNIVGFLLKKDGGYLLKMVGGRIILRNPTIWTNQTKN